MNKVLTFIRESYEELTQKVSWPTYSELQSSTTLVIVASVIFAVLIWAVDVIFERGIGLIYEYI